MRNLILSRLLPLAAALMLSPACDAPQSFAEASTKTQARAVEGFRPAFTNETVIKLNATVEKAKATLDRFDDVMLQVADARKAKNAAEVSALETELAMLRTASDDAAAAFQAEKQALLSRDEVYDPIVLGTMEQFVMDAPREIADSLPAKAQ